MNTLFRTVTTIAATILTFTILLDSAAYAASARQPIYDCRGPACVIDDDTTDETTDSEQSVNLAWTAPTTRTDGEPLSLSELEGYRIYYGTDSNNMIPLVDLDDSSITTYSITDLSPGIYYFSVTAYDYEGLESGFSEVANKEIL